jgi:hypothetical protein
MWVELAVFFAVVAGLLFWVWATLPPPPLQVLLETGHKLLSDGNRGVLLPSWRASCMAWDQECKAAMTPEQVKRFTSRGGVFDPYQRRSDVMQVLRDRCAKLELIVTRPR